MGQKGLLRTIERDGMTIEYLTTHNLNVLDPVMQIASYVNVLSPLLLPTKSHLTFDNYTQALFGCSIMYPRRGTQGGGRSGADSVDLTNTRAARALEVRLQR